MKDIHNSSGGAWHSGKYLANKRVTDEYLSSGKKMSDGQIRKNLQKEIVGVVEVVMEKTAKQNLESDYSYLNPGEKKNLNVTLGYNKDYVHDPRERISKKDRIVFTPVSIKIGQLKINDIQRQMKFMKKSE